MVIQIGLPIGLISPESSLFATASISDIVRRQIVMKIAVIYVSAHVSCWLFVISTWKGRIEERRARGRQKQKYPDNLCTS